MNLTISGPTILAAIGGIMVIVATVWSSYQQDRLQEKLQEKTEEVASLTNESLNVLKGGDSYPILSPSFEDTNNTIYFSLNNDGKYPLYDLDLYISEIDNLKSEFFPTVKHFDEVGSGKGELNIYKTTLPDNVESKSISVITTARNGETRQIYKCFRSSGTLGVKTEIYRNGTLIKTE